MLGGMPNFTARSAIQAIAFVCLRSFDGAELFETGYKVSLIVDDFKRNFPAEIPNVTLVLGLLDWPDGTAVPVDDFTLAQHLIAIRHPQMVEIETCGLPILMAYVSVIAAQSEMPSERWLDSALPFAVQSIAYENVAQDRFTNELRIKYEAAVPLAQLGQKMTAGRQRGSLGPVAKAVRKVLTKTPQASAADVWDTLALSKPKGLTFVQNRRGDRLYVEQAKRTRAGNIPNTSYGRFNNIVSEQKKALRTR